MDSVDTDIEPWNPGEKSFDWLDFDDLDIKILIKEEIEKLSGEPDKLYFVKWK